MHNSIDIANHILFLAHQDNNQLTPMQLLKIVYIAHGWHLGYHGKPLIKEEAEAWQYGPVVPSVYHQFKPYGKKEIRSQGNEYEHENMDLTEAVYHEYKQYSGGQLSTITHEKGSPWETVYDISIKDQSIPNDFIEIHYRNLIPN